jgi:hypothetical protein
MLSIWVTYPASALGWKAWESKFFYLYLDFLSPL